METLELFLQEMLESGIKITIFFIIYISLEYKEFWKGF